MVNKPIKIKDYSSPVENTRLQLMKEVDKKMTNGKGFTFKGFVTEKERIKKFLAERNKFLNENDDGTFNNDKNKNKNNPKYVQPQMRFKPRSELERIFDVINEYSYGRVSRDLIDKQLKNLELTQMKKVKNYNDSDSNISETIEQVTANNNLQESNNLDKLDKLKDIIVDELSNKEKHFKKKKILINNSEAKNMMKEYHFKTHFKAASVVASNLNNHDNNKIYKNNSQVNLKMNTGNNFYANKNIKISKNSHNINELNGNKIFSKSGSNFYLRNNNNNNSDSESPNLFKKFSLKFSLEEENLDIIECNPLLYNLNMNPIRKSNNSHSELNDKDKLEYLKNLAYHKEDETEKLNLRKGVKFIQNLKGRRRANVNDNKLEGNPMLFFRGLKYNSNDENEIVRKDDDKIWVDNELVSKTQVDLIARKILRNCNYVHHKKDEADIIKKGNGKLMITAGMTLNEFTKKYNIPK